MKNLISSFTTWLVGYGSRFLISEMGFPHLLGEGKHSSFSSRNPWLSGASQGWHWWCQLLSSSSLCPPWLNPHSLPLLHSDSTTHGSDRWQGGQIEDYFLGTMDFSHLGLRSLLLTILTSGSQCRFESCSLKVTLYKPPFVLMTNPPFVWLKVHSIEDLRFSVPRFYAWPMCGS